MYLYHNQLRGTGLGKEGNKVEVETRAAIEEDLVATDEAKSSMVLSSPIIVNAAHLRE